jgi:hypothetical protein
MISPTYMQRQTDINERMRSILNDWLIEVRTAPSSSLSLPVTPPSGSGEKDRSQERVIAFVCSREHRGQRQNSGASLRCHVSTDRPCCSH